MDRQIKKVNSSKSERVADRLQARRPLHSVALEPPEYTIDPELLLRDGGYYEKDIRVRLRPAVFFCLVDFL